MNKRRLGPNGPMVSALGLGCMGMSEGYGAADEGEAIATIQRALDLGLSFLDTADIYGPHKNEILVGGAIRSRRSEVFLATKFGFVGEPDRASTQRLNAKPEYVPLACDASLRRLGVEAIDLYYLHRVDPEVPIEDTVGAMGELVGAGKVRYLGLSEVGPATLRRAQAVHPITALQSEYSLWTRDPEDNGSLQACESLGVGFVPFSPLGRGFLTGAIRSPADFEANDVRRGQPRFQGENFLRNLQLVEKLQHLAHARQCTPGQLALAWVLGRSEHIVPIPGTKHRSRLDENIGALQITLNAEELAAIDAIFARDGVAGSRYRESMLELFAP